LILEFDEQLSKLAFKCNLRLYSMVAVNENQQVETLFPMQRSGGCLTDGDAVGFDYNREIHIIADLPTKNADRRITLKVGRCSLTVS
jgi:hypothetical protein